MDAGERTIEWLYKNQLQLMHSGRYGPNEASPGGQVSMPRLSRLPVKRRGLMVPWDRVSGYGPRSCVIST